MNRGPVLPSQSVSTQWLADYLGADNLVVLDASVVAYKQPNGTPGYISGHELYLLDGHIPGAYFADVIDELSDPDGTYPFTRPSAERFAAAIGALGIGNSTTVVIYDSAVGQWAARVWWLLRSFGYDNVAILDGGLTSWKLEERPTDVGHVQPPVVPFAVSERPELWVDKEYVEGILRGDIDAALVCATPSSEFSGESVPRGRPGHIPGSLSVPAVSLVDEAHALLPAASLRATFAPALGAARIVVYCGAGIAATADAFALTLLGETSIAVYDGSLNEWAADPEAQLVSGF